MNNTKIGNKEAIALLLTITFNHIILTITKSIIDATSSASLLNILYISIFAIAFTFIICYFLKKFPTYDLIDISNFLGGNLIKWIIGIAYIAYFVFFSGILLNIFSSFLQITYFPLTKISYIILLFIISALLSCNMKYNAVYRSNLILIYFFTISFLLLFLSNFSHYDYDKIYPILGNGAFSTFVSGFCNMFAFQAIAYIYFLPPILRNPEQIKKISITAIILSCVFLLLSISIIMFMFNGFVKTDDLVSLYSATKYIEFGSFFRNLDSIYLLIWIITFLCYLNIALKVSSNILKKLVNSKKEIIFNIFIAVLIFIVSISPKNYNVSTYCSNIVYKYCFFILILGISFIILISANLKKRLGGKKNE